MSRTQLSDSTVRERLEARPHWRLENGTLVREFEFPDFVRAFGFMCSVALIAQAMDHHPDWTNVYNRLRIALHTHDAGGITDRDFELAERIDGLGGGDPLAG